MTDNQTPAPAWDAPTPEVSSGKLGAAGEQASDLKDQATESGHKVAGTTRDEVQNVAHEAKSQVRGLAEQAREELRDQAAQQQSRLAEGLRTVGDELSEMADASNTGGLASELVGQASSRVDSVAIWLDNRDPGSLIDELRAFASKRPLAFLAIAAAGGVVAGRLTKSIAGAQPPPVDSEIPDDTRADTPIYASVTEPSAVNAPPTAQGQPAAGWASEGNIGGGSAQ